MKSRRPNLMARLAVAAGLVVGAMTAPAVAGDGEIIIGAPVSLTGRMSGPGHEQLWAYKQAVADINKKGGIMIKSAGRKLPVRLVVADDESAESKVAAVVESLIKTQNVDVLLSTHSGPLNLTGAIVAEKYRTFYMITTCLPFEWRPYRFRHSALFFFHPAQGAEVPFKIWESIPEDQRPKKPALVFEDTPDGKGLRDAFVAASEKYGYKIAFDDPWIVGATDYSALITKMQGAGVDAILLFGPPTDSVTLVRQMKKLDFSVPYLHGWKGTWTGEFADALGKDSDYILTDGFWSASFPYPGAKELGDRFEAEFGRDSVSVGAFYANAQILFEAIARAGTTDSAAIHDAIFNQEFKDTVIGDLKFDETGFALIPSVATQWWKGHHRLLYPNPAWEYRPAPGWKNR